MSDHNDYQPPEKPILTEEQWLSALKESMKGFHGKYDRKTGGNKPTSRNYTFTPIRYGTPDVPDKYNPSYSKIKNDGVLLIGAILDTKGLEITPEKVYKYEICQNRITIDGYYVCDAPDYHSNGKKYTPYQKEKFCKVVIWQLLTDEGSLTDQIAKLGNGPIERVIRDIPERITVDDYVPVDTPEINIDHIVENITLSPYPGIGVLEQSMKNKHWLEIEDREYATRDLTRDVFEDMYPMGSEYDSLSLETEYNKGEESVLYNLINPSIIRSWRHGSMIIQEIAA